MTISHINLSVFINAGITLNRVTKRVSLVSGRSLLKKSGTGEYSQELLQHLKPLLKHYS